MSLQPYSLKKRLIKSNLLGRGTRNMLLVGVYKIEISYIEEKFLTELLKKKIIRFSNRFKKA